MEIAEFKPGFLIWQQYQLQPTDSKLKRLLCQTWQEGIVTFSAEEQRVDETLLKRLPDFLAGRSDQTGGPEGYMMEADLWRNDGPDGAWEELALERQGETFMVQHWKLLREEVNPEEDGLSCYYRTAQTSVRGNITAIKGNLVSFEVIVPEYRLRIYLTKGGA